jgi:hypothetical protein
MKKRNKPIVLTTLLVLMIGAVAFVNFPRDLVAGQHGPGDGHDHGGEAPKTGNNVDVPDKDSIANSVASSVKGSGGPGAGRPGGPPGRPGKPGMPGENSGSVIEVQTYAPQKPTYNDSATSTQWYTDEAPKEAPKSK